MIWLTWRQFRIQALIGFAVMAVAVAVLAATRPALLDLARDSGFTDCTANCAGPAKTFLSLLKTAGSRHFYFAGIVLPYLIPTMIGLFWGAPMVARELETGTHRLVWNQTVSRTRWLAVKLGGIGLTAALVSGLTSLAITWWAGPIDAADNRITPLIFAARGVVPVAYAAFAFVAGVTIGLLLRRTIPAMLVTLVVVAGLQAGSPFLLRPHLVAHNTSSTALTVEAIGSIGLSPDDPTRQIRVTAESPITDGWMISTRLLTAAGEPFTGPYDPATCGMEATGSPRSCPEWIAAQNLEVRSDYIAADKFWALQWRESGLFLVASALLAIFCFWWIRRRVA